MVVKAKSKRTKLNRIIQAIEQIDIKRQALWERYDAATSWKKQDTIRDKLHPLDEIKYFLFVQLWDLYYDFPDEIEHIGQVYSEISKKKTDVYCDGQFHFVVFPKTDKLKYAYDCDC